MLDFKQFLSVYRLSDLYEVYYHAYCYYDQKYEDIKTLPNSLLFNSDLTKCKASSLMAIPLVFEMEEGNHHALWVSKLYHCLELPPGWSYRWVSFQEKVFIYGKVSSKIHPSIMFIHQVMEKLVNKMKEIKVRGKTPTHKVSVRNRFHFKKSGCGQKWERINLRDELKTLSSENREYEKRKPKLFNLAFMSNTLTGNVTKIPKKKSVKVKNNFIGIGKQMSTNGTKTVPQSPRAEFTSLPVDCQWLKPNTTSTEKMRCRSHFRQHALRQKENIQQAEYKVKNISGLSTERNLQRIQSYTSIREPKIISRKLQSAISIPVIDRRSATGDHFFPKPGNRLLKLRSAIVKK